MSCRFLLQYDSVVEILSDTAWDAPVSHSIAKVGRRPAIDCVEVCFTCALQLSQVRTAQHELLTLLGIELPSKKRYDCCSLDSRCIVACRSTKRQLDINVTLQYRPCRGRSNSSYTGRCRLQRPDQGNGLLKSLAQRYTSCCPNARCYFLRSAHVAATHQVPISCLLSPLTVVSYVTLTRPPVAPSLR